MVGIDGDGRTAFAGGGGVLVLLADTAAGGQGVGGGASACKFDPPVGGFSPSIVLLLLDASSYRSIKTMKNKWLIIAVYPTRPNFSRRFRKSH